MAQSTTTNIPAYFQLTDAIFSTIGLHNVLLGLMVGGIRGGFSLTLLVPIVVSAACALANGMAYIAYFAEYSVVSKAAASAVASFAWLIQEGGLPFYGYMILTPTLHGRERLILLAIFWPLMLVVVALRAVIIVVEPLFILGHISPTLFQTVETNLGVTCFVAIAFAECTTGVSSVTMGGRLFIYLIRSTEIRLTTLTFIGMLRAVTFSLRIKGTGAIVGVAGQLDTFAIALEALFPMVMLIDLLASPLVFESDRSARRNNLDSSAAMYQSASTVWSRNLHRSEEGNLNPNKEIATRG